MDRASCQGHGNAPACHCLLRLCIEVTRSTICAQFCICPKASTESFQLRTDLFQHKALVMASKYWQLGCPTGRGFMTCTPMRTLLVGMPTSNPRKQSKYGSLHHPSVVSGFVIVSLSHHVSPYVFPPGQLLEMKMKRRVRFKARCRQCLRRTKHRDKLFIIPTRDLIAALTVPLLPLHPIFSTLR